MRTFKAVTGGLFWLLLTNLSIAHTTVVVVPMDDDELQVGGAEPLPSLPGGENIVNVSALGNGDFDDLATAMASITDAAAARPYLILLAPGEYVLDAPLQVEPFVSLRGAGNDETSIRGQVGAASPGAGAALLSTASHSTISRLKLHNAGNGVAGHSAIGIYSECNGCQLLDLEVVLDNPDNRNYGVYSVGIGTRITGVDVIVDAVGDNQNIGVYENGSNGEFYRLGVDVTGGVSSCALVAGSSSSATVRDSRLDIGALPAAALRFEAGSSARLVNTRIDGIVVPAGSGHCYNVFGPGGVPVSC